MIDEAKRRNIILGIVAVVTVLVVWTLFGLTRTGTLTISAPKNTPNNSTVSVKVLRDSTEVNAFTLNPGETKSLRMGKGVIRVDGKAGNLKSTDVVQVKGFSTTKLETPTGEQRVAQQLASDAQYCPLVVGDVTYSYACDGEGPITHHSSNMVGGSLNTKLFDGTSFSRLKPYQSGAIGFYASAGGPTNLLYINLATESITIVKLPDAIQSLLRSTPDIAVSTVQSDTRFGLLFDEDNKAYVFQSITDTHPIEIKPDKDVKLNEDGRVAKLSFTNNTPVLFVGSTNDTGEGTQTTTADNPKQLTSYLFEYTSKGSITKTITLPENMEAQGVYKLTDDLYVADQPYGFGVYVAKGDDLEHVYTLDDMSSWAISKQNAYVAAGGTLYEFKPGEQGQFSLHSLFSSTSITVSSVFNSPRGILFTGLPDGASDAPLNIYQLLDKKAEQQNTPATTEPTYSGIDGMVYLGLSSFQANNLRFALGNYVAANEPQTTSIELLDLQPAPRDRFTASTVNTINFTVRIGRGKEVPAKIEYFDLSAIHLYLYDKNTGAVLYDSGVINHKDAPSYNPEPEH